MAATRRAAGEGSIFHLADGRWRGQLNYRQPDGRRRRLSGTFRTRREAAGWLAEEQKRQANQSLAINGSVTMDGWWRTYQDEVAAQRLRPSSYVRAEGAWRKHVSPYVGHVKVQDLAPAHLSRLYAERLRAGLAPASVRVLHAIIRRALAVAVRWDIVSRNVATLVEPPSVPHKEIVPLSLQEAQALLAAAAEDRLAARWQVGLSMGLRQGEVLGLPWRLVDLDEGTLRVGQALTRAPHGKLALVQPKTPRSRRTLRLPAGLVEALRVHRDRQAEELALLGLDEPEHGLVFMTTVGTAIHPRNDLRSFYALVQRAGIRRVRLHDLRHTAASLLLAQGVPARVVMEVLGHSQIGLTMNTYSHVMPVLMHDAAERMDALLWAPPPTAGPESG